MRPELSVLIGIVFGELLKLAKQLLRERVADLEDDRVFLEGLSRDTQRKILRLDDAAHEPKVLREQALVVAVDEHPLDVELKAHLPLAETRDLRVALGNEDESRELNRRVDIEMHVAGRLVDIVRDELVELVVLFLRDLRRLLAPEGRRLVGSFFADVDGKGDEARVLADCRADGVLVAESGLLLFEVNLDPRSARRRVRSRLDGVTAEPVTRPADGRRARVRRTSREDDALRAHEHRIEAHAELSDEAQVAFLRLGIIRGVVAGLAPFLQLLEERRRAAVGDRPDVLLHLVFGHSDAGIGDDEDLLLVVSLGGLGRDANLERRIGILDRLALHLGEAYLFERVRGVREKFADEDIFRGVDRVDEDIEELPNLGLELVTRGRAVRSRGVCFGHGVLRGIPSCKIRRLLVGRFPPGRFCRGASARAACRRVGRGALPGSAGSSFCARTTDRPSGWNGSAPGGAPRVFVPRSEVPTRGRTRSRTTRFSNKATSGTPSSYRAEVS